ncbi:hypothetical protein [Virgibacillus sp. L01]|uniref:hypothetical protein n=1 Tax=Virgibacillus sp. L01 TaxID=3457429 RepID=UPI003FD443E8
MRILDIDMDFFLDGIAHWQNGEERLNDEDFKPWNEEEFKRFLEDKCLLSKDNPIKGRIIKEHNEAFFFWDELIKEHGLMTPFHVTHIDAHSDTGLGDSGYIYIMGELMLQPIEKRRELLKLDKVWMGNYLSYAMACGWISDINFVVPEFWENEMFSGHLKNFSDDCMAFQFKGFKDIDIGMSYERIVGRMISPTTIDDEIPFKIIRNKEYQAEEKYDRIVFCQSPSYTPQKADYMLEVIKPYIIEE